MKDTARKVRALLKGKSAIVATVAFLALLIAIEGAMLLGGSAPTRPSDNLDILWAGHYRNDRDRWEKAIDELGTRRAYEEFVRDTAGKDFGVSHTLAHIMGELVYEKEGIDGIAICDSSFGFGCYHSFFGKAISERGIGVVDELDEACVKQWGPLGLGCPHGIGHGIQGYFGDEGLSEALEICERLSWKGPIGGCSSGVFMEFNFHTMESLRGAESRPYDPEDSLYPCDGVGSRFSQSCYYELPSWLLGPLGGDFKAIGDVCGSVPGKADREACYKGVGTSAAESSSYDASAIAASCSLMPDREGEIMCRAGAAWALFAQPSTRDRREEPCTDLSASEKGRCIEHSEVIQFEAAAPRL